MIATTTSIPNIPISPPISLNKLQKMRLIRALLFSLPPPLLLFSPNVSAVRVRVILPALNFLRFLALPRQRFPVVLAPGVGIGGGEAAGEVAVFCEVGEGVVGVIVVWGA